jgi:hypothetical protein
MNLPRIFVVVQNLAEIEKRSNPHIERTHANEERQDPPLFFSRETTRRTEVSRRLITPARVFCDAGAALSPYRPRQSSRQRTCLRTDAEPSITARESYTRLKKGESRETGVRAKNTAPKAIYDRVPDSQQIIVAQTAKRAHKPVRTPYLAINWQRGNINAQLTWQDQRFPSPQQPHTRNSDAEIGAPVTTNHLFWPNERRRISSLLPNSQPNSEFLGYKHNDRGGRGGSARRTRPKTRY